MNTKSITPPAGFRTETFMECGEGGQDPCEPYGTCHHEKDVTYAGPGYYAAKDWRISTQWTPERGIFYMIAHDGLDIWTPEEIAELPAAIDTIERKIGEDAAVELLESQTHLLQPASTVNQLANFAVDNGVSAAAVFAAYQTLTAHQEADKAVGN